MNKRIRELMIQAMTETGRLEEGVQASYQRFAELIVRECICQCDDENSQKYIMSHFGFTEKDWS